MQPSERVQVSLPFETEDELDLYQKVVFPLRQNRQLRQTLLDLLSLLRDKPLEIEALLNGENLAAQDEYAKDFMDEARLLEQNLININSKLNQTYHGLATTPVDSILSSMVQEQQTPQPDITVPTPTHPDTGVLNTEEIKQQITKSVLDAVLPNIKDMLDDLKTGIISQQQSTPTHPDTPIEPLSSSTQPTTNFEPKPKLIQESVKPVTPPLEPATSSGFKIRDFDEEDEDLLNLDNNTVSGGTKVQSQPVKPTPSDTDTDFITKMMMEAAESSLG